MEREDIRIEPPEKVVRFITAPGHIYRRKIKIVRIIVRPIRRTVRHPSAAVADTVSKMPVSQFSAGSFTIFFRFAPYAYRPPSSSRPRTRHQTVPCRGDSSKSSGIVTIPCEMRWTDGSQLSGFSGSSSVISTS